MPRVTKKSASGAGSIRRRNNGTWEARITIGYDPNTGRQKQKSIYGATQREVRQKMTEIASQLDSDTYVEPARMTLDEWLSVWLNEFCSDKKWSTLRNYRAAIETHIRPAMGSLRLSQINTIAAQSFINRLTSEKHLNPKTVKNVYGVLRKCLDVALRLGYIGKNPVALVILPRVEKKPIEPLTDDQVARMVSSAGSDGYGTLFKLVVFTGLRLAEAIGLTWECIDFQRGTIRVEKQLQKRPVSQGGFTFTPLKNDKVRTVVAAPFVMDMLKQWQREQTANRLAAGPLWNGWSNEAQRGSSVVFTNNIGEHLHPQTVYNHFKKLAAEIGAPHARVHDLRHTYAVLSLQNGDDIKTVQGNLGHATAAFTLDVYGHVSTRMQQESANRMQQYIAGLR